MKTKSFVLFESIIYICFIIMDLFNIDSTYIKYLGIVLCLIYSLFNKKKVQCFAMFFTLIADFFLLVVNKYYEIGLISFIIVQLVYLYFLGNYNKAYFNMFLLIRGFICVFCVLTLNIIDQLTLLNILVIIYFSNLVLNMVQSHLLPNKILAIGLSLFVCCDICVGLHNINVAYEVSTFLMWVFYLPSQVLIVLS